MNYQHRLVESPFMTYQNLSSSPVPSPILPVLIASPFCVLLLSRYISKDLSRFQEGLIHVRTLHRFQSSPSPPFPQSERSSPVPIVLSSHAVVASLCIDIGPSCLPPPGRVDASPGEALILGWRASATLFPWDLRPLSPLYTETGAGLVGTERCCVGSGQRKRRQPISVNGCVLCCSRLNR